MDEVMDMRDEMEDWEEGDSSEEDEIKSRGMHVEGGDEEGEPPIEEERE